MVEVSTDASDAMSQVIDWSRYGRSKRIVPEVEISYRDLSHVIICDASFPMDRLDEVIEKLRAQRDYWKAEGKAHESRGR